MIEKFPYVIGQPAEIFHNGEWKKGKIVDGYRFQDGVVTIITEGGETVWCGEARKDLYRPLENLTFRRKAGKGKV